MRERLIELLKECDKQEDKVIYSESGSLDFNKWVELYADYLLKNGVVVLPCKVYQTDGVRVYESEVTKVIYRTKDLDFDEDAIGSSIFLTKEEAETELKGRTTNG